MTEPYEDAVTNMLGVITDNLVKDMPPDEYARAQVLTEMIEKICTGENIATVALAITVALKETFEEWAQTPDDDPDPPDDDKPVPEPANDLKLVG